MFRISEDKTRKETIDPELEKAGWFLRDHSRVGIKILFPMRSRQELFYYLDRFYLHKLLVLEIGDI